MASNGFELSEREQEILRLVATGASNKQIAHQLVISTNTVKVHLRNIFSKIGVTSRTEATLFAIREGFAAQPVSANHADYPSGPSTEQLEQLNPQELQGQRTTNRRHFSRYALFFGTLGFIIIAGMFFISRGEIPVLGVQATPTTAFTRWQIKSRIPEGRSYAAAAPFDGQIYIFGGYNDQGVTNSGFRFSPITNKWQALAPKSTPVADYSAGVIGEKIYMPGGTDVNGDPSNVLEVYDPRKDKWETRAPLPTPISKYGLATYNGRLYVFGGWNGKEYLSTVYVYDPSKDTWNRGTDIPSEIASPSVINADAQIFMIGGQNRNRAISNNQVYFPDRDLNQEHPWATKKPLPSGKYSMGAVSLADSIYLIGGNGDKRGKNTSWIYSIDRDTWTQFDTSPIGSLSGSSVVAMDNFIYIIGGETESKQKESSVVTYQAIYSIELPILGN